jgi:hypothetical protein
MSPTTKQVCLAVVMADVANQGSVWISRPNGSMLCVIRRISGPSRCLQVSAAEPDVACLSLSATAEAVWCILANGRVYIRAGMQMTCPQGRYWQPVNMVQLESNSEKLVQVSISSQSVWAVTNVGNIYLRTGVLQPPAPLNPAWVPITECVAKSLTSSVQFSHVAASPDGCLVWALDRKGGVYVREGITDELPCGTQWASVSGLVAEQLTCSNDTVYAIDGSGELFVRLGVTDKHPAGQNWHKIPGALTRLAASADNELWGLDGDGQLLQRQIYVLRRPRVLDSLVREKPSEANNDWVLV